MDHMIYCSLMSGSWGNCHYINAGATSILIDAGQSGRRILENIEMAGRGPATKLSAIVVTHAHIDHVAGVGVLARRLRVPVYATEGAWFEMSALVGEIPAEQRRAITLDERWSIGDLSLEAFPTSHDALESVGFVVRREREEVLGIATDSGVFTNQMERALRDARTLVIESNHDPEMLRTGKYPYYLKARIAGIDGHLSNEDAGRAINKVRNPNLRQIVLAHLSQENNTWEKAMSSVKQEMASAYPGASAPSEPALYIAPRHAPGKWLEV